MAQWVHQQRALETERQCVHQLKALVWALPRHLDTDWPLAERICAILNYVRQNSQVTELDAFLCTFYDTSLELLPMASLGTLPPGTPAAICDFLAPGDVAPSAVGDTLRRFACRQRAIQPEFSISTSSQTSGSDDNDDNDDNDKNDFLSAPARSSMNDLDNLDDLDDWNMHKPSRMHIGCCYVPPKA